MKNMLQRYDITSDDIIAGNSRVLKAYMFIMWLLKGVNLSFQSQMSNSVELQFLTYQIRPLLFLHLPYIAGLYKFFSAFLPGFSLWLDSNWYIRSNPEDRINRKLEDQIFDWRTKNAKKRRTENVFYLIFGPI